MASFFMPIYRVIEITGKKNADRSQHFLKFNSKVRIIRQQRC